MKILKTIGTILLVGLIVAQFFQPEKNQGQYNLQPFFKETQADAKMQTILFNACADCHSNVTKYPWYNQITPINFWLADHVNEGKSELNFSEWESYSAKKKAHKLEESYEMVEQKEMPLESYTWVHNEAKLTDEEVKLIVAWAKNAKEKIEAQ